MSYEQTDSKYAGLLLLKINFLNLDLLLKTNTDNEKTLNTLSNDNSNIIVYCWTNDQKTNEIFLEWEPGLIMENESIIVNKPFSICSKVWCSLINTE